MASNNNSNMAKGEAKAAMNRFKFEVANEIGVPLKEGYNGDLTSAQNGYVGGYMVNNIYPEQNRKYLRNLRSLKGHCFAVTYHYSVVV
ncbi:MAG: alpha/beta-type small acid-soluble spore protein [Firmicutes bacterium]|nr:alpha/beta-type small acid-soluble spore protein [Bacillota bacterium]